MTIKVWNGLVLALAWIWAAFVEAGDDSQYTRKCRAKTGLFIDERDRERLQKSSRLNCWEITD